MCNIKNYRYDETFQFATPKTTGMTRRLIYNIKNYRYDEVKNFAGKKYLMKE